MYPPNSPIDGIYRVKLLAAEQDDAAYYIRYDISVGPCVGWATYMYQQTGKWPLIWRLDKHRGATAIRCALNALNSGDHVRMQSLEESAGHYICLELHRRSDANYIDVKKSLPVSAYRITPDDIRVGTAGGWRQGDPNWRYALLLANLSGLPVLNADSREGKSPMVNWCAEHGVIILPQYLPAGDYTLLNGNAIVDRKDNILELYKDFAGSQNRESYEKPDFCWDPLIQTDLSASNHVSTCQLCFYKERRGLSDNLGYALRVKPVMRCNLFASHKYYMRHGKIIF